MDKELIISGEELRQIRKKIGLTQIELAESLDVHKNTVQNWEKKGNITHSNYTKLCALLRDENVAIGDNSTNVSGNGNTIEGRNTTAALEMALAEIAEQRKLLSDTIKNHNDQLSKSQQQIDRLIGLLERE